jgi:hypothetical protein
MDNLNRHATDSTYNCFSAGLDSVEESLPEPLIETLCASTVQDNAPIDGAQVNTESYSTATFITTERSIVVLTIEVGPRQSKTGSPQCPF